MKDDMIGETHSLTSHIPVDGALAALQRRMQELFAVAHGHPIEAQCLTAIAAVEYLAMVIEQAQSAEQGSAKDLPRGIEARAKVVEDTLRASGVGLLVTHPSDGPAALQSVVRAVDASRPGRALRGRSIAALKSADAADLAEAITPEMMRDAALFGTRAAIARHIGPSPDPEHARVTMTPLDRLRVIAGLVQTLPCDRPELWCALPVDIVATLPGAEVDVQPRKDEPGKMLHVARATVAGLRVVALETRDASPEDEGRVST